VITRERPDYFSHLLTLNEIDRLLTTLDFQHPRVVLVNTEREIKIAEYTAYDNTIDVAELYRLHAAGATIILNQLHTRHPALAELCAALELELSAPVQTNVYVTPPRAKGFKVHFDSHDVLVLQLHGRKHWRLFGTPIPLPLEEHSLLGASDPGTPIREIDLMAGDTLYIPRGILHDACACDETSVHAIVGLLSYTWSDLLIEALHDVILKDPRFRRSLPREFG
jgi:ribosomal protein L16 Arg81 hydroxylase